MIAEIEKKSGTFTHSRTKVQKLQIYRPQKLMKISIYLVHIMKTIIYHKGCVASEMKVA